jgi:transposase
MGARGLVIRDDVGAAELRRFAQGEADRPAALRAVAIAQALEGASRAEAARVVGRERQSLRDAVVRFNAEGLAGLWDRPRPGRPEKLTAAQREELRAWLLAGPDPEVDGVSSYRLVDIAAHIQERWAVSYTLSALSRLLHRVGLSWQTTRPVHPKGDAEAQELYKKPRGHTRSRQGRPSRQDAAAVV